MIDLEDLLYFQRLAQAEADAETKINEERFFASVALDKDQKARAQAAKAQNKVEEKERKRTAKQETKRRKQEEKGSRKDGDLLGPEPESEPEPEISTHRSESQALFDTAPQPSDIQGPLGEAAAETLAGVELPNQADPVQRTGWISISDREQLYEQLGFASEGADDTQSRIDVPPEYVGYMIKVIGNIRLRLMQVGASEPMCDVQLLGLSAEVFKRVASIRVLVQLQSVEAIAGSTSLLLLGASPALDEQTADAGLEVDIDTITDRPGIKTSIIASVGGLNVGFHPHFVSAIVNAFVPMKTAAAEPPIVNRAVLAPHLNWGDREVPNLNSVAMKFAVTDIKICCPESIESQAKPVMVLCCEKLLLDSNHDQLCTETFAAMMGAEELAPQTSKCQKDQLQQTIRAVSRSGYKSLKVELLQISVSIQASSSLSDLKTAIEPFDCTTDIISMQSFRRVHTVLPLLCVQLRPDQVKLLAIWNQSVLAPGLNSQPRDVGAWPLPAARQENPFDAAALLEQFMTIGFSGCTVDLITEAEGAQIRVPAIQIAAARNRNQTKRLTVEICASDLIADAILGPDCYRMVTLSHIEEESPVLFLDIVGSIIHTADQPLNSYAAQSISLLLGSLMVDFTAPCRSFVQVFIAGFKSDDPAPIVPCFLPRQRRSINLQVPSLCVKLAEFGDISISAQLGTVGSSEPLCAEEALLSVDIQRVSVTCQGRHCLLCKTPNRWTASVHKTVNCALATAPMTQTPAPPEATMDANVSLTHLQVDFQLLLLFVLKCKGIGPQTQEQCDCVPSTTVITACAAFTFKTGTSDRSFHCSADVTGISANSQRSIFALILRGFTIDSDRESLTESIVKIQGAKLSGFESCILAMGSTANDLSALDTRPEDNESLVAKVKNESVHVIIPDTQIFIEDSLLASLLPWIRSIVNISSEQHSAEAANIQQKPSTQRCLRVSTSGIGFALGCAQGAVAFTVAFDVLFELEQGGILTSLKLELSKLDASVVDRTSVGIKQATHIASLRNGAEVNLKRDAVATNFEVKCSAIKVDFTLSTATLLTSLKTSFSSIVWRSKQEKRPMDQGRKPRNPTVVQPRGNQRKLNCTLTCGDVVLSLLNSDSSGVEMVVLARVSKLHAKIKKTDCSTILSIKPRFSLQGFNRYHSSFEPLLEDVRLSIDLEIDVGTAVDGAMQLLLSPADPRNSSIEFCLTPAVASALFRLTRGQMSHAVAQPAPADAPAPFDIFRGSALDMQSCVGSVRVMNETGQTVHITPCGSTAHVVLDSDQTEDVKFLFSDDDHICRMAFDMKLGEQKHGRIDVSRVGTSVVSSASVPQQGASSSQLVCVVELLGNERRVSLRSKVYFVNCTELTVLVQVKTRDGTCSTVARLTANQGLSFPTNAETFQFRPADCESGGDDAIAHSWCAAQKCEAVQQQIIVPCSLKKSATIWYSNISRSVTALADGTSAQTVSIGPPTTLSNRLPFRIQYRLYQEDNQIATGFLDTAGIEHVHSAPPSCMVSFQCVGFTWSRRCKLESCPCIVDLPDLHGEICHLNMAYEEVPQRPPCIILYCDTLLINRSGLNLSYSADRHIQLPGTFAAQIPATAGGTWFAGIDADPNGVPAMVSAAIIAATELAEPRMLSTKKLYLRADGAHNKSDWTHAYNTRVEGDYSAVIVDSAGGDSWHADLSVEIKRCSRKFRRSRVITLKPQLHVHNRTASPLLVKQYEAHDSSAVLLAPGVCTPWFWGRASKKLWLVVKRAAGDEENLRWCWCPPVNPKTVNNTVVGTKLARSAASRWKAKAAVNVRTEFEESTDVIGALAVADVVDCLETRRDLEGRPHLRFIFEGQSAWVSGSDEKGAELMTEEATQAKSGLEKPIDEVVEVRADLVVDGGLFNFVLSAPGSGSKYRVENHCSAISVKVSAHDLKLARKELPGCCDFLVVGPKSAAVYHMQQPALQPTKVHLQFSSEFNSAELTLDLDSVSMEHKPLKFNEAVNLAVAVQVDGVTKVLHVWDTDVHTHDAGEKSMLLSRKRVNLNVHLPHVGFTLCGSLFAHPRSMHDVLYFGIRGLVLQVDEHDGEQRMELLIKTIQVDSGCQSSPFPVVFSPSLPVDESKSFLQFIIVKEVKDSTVNIYRYGAVLMQEADLKIETSLLAALSTFWHQVHSSAADTSSTVSDLADSLETRPPSAIDADAADAKTLYIELLQINPIKVSVTFNNSAGAMEVLSDNPLLSSNPLLDAIGNVEAAPLKLNGVTCARLHLPACSPLR